MEEQYDLFTQKRFELIVEMATKKLQQEIDSLKETVSSLNTEITSMKSQISRSQLQNPQDAQKPAVAEKQAPKKAHPLYGNLDLNEITIEKFFYVGGK